MIQTVENLPFQPWFQWLSNTGVAKFSTKSQLREREIRLYIDHVHIILHSTTHTNIVIG